MTSDGRSDAGRQSTTATPAKVLRLESEALLVDVLPENGADVFAIVDRRTGVDLLWKAPWGSSLDPEQAPTSRDRWLAQTWGGWQVLLPNTGDQALERGQNWGFHGEAGLRAWSVSSADRHRTELTLDLRTAPLRLNRTYRLEGAILTVDTTIENASSEPVEFLWGEHPSYSEAFAGGAVLEIAATSIRIEMADRVGVEAGDRLAWPGRAELGGGSLDRIPPRTEPRFLFAFVEGLQTGSYRVRNDRLGLAARLTWPLELFPCVWLWEEIEYTQDQPWDGRAYAVGIEPQTAYPALGMTELRRSGQRGLSVGPHDWLMATITLGVEQLNGQT